jgi:prophage tail gpP-like protein
MRLVIGEKEYNNITQYTINQKYNSIASSFSLVVNADVLDYVLDYPECEIYDDSDNLILTGIVLAPSITTTAQPNTITLRGYSLAGVLEDCPVPKSSYPLQFDNLNLLEITDKLLGPFGLNYNIQGDILEDALKRYPKLEIEPEQRVKQILSDLSSQRNIYLTHNEFGEVVFTRFDPSKFLSIMFIEEGSFGVKSINLDINSQALHSEITVVKQATKKSPDSAEVTINNPYVDKFRPTTKVMVSGDNLDIDKAARNALAAELSNIVITINVQSDKYVKPGTTIELKAPSIKLNNPTVLFIEEVNYTSTVNNSNQYTIKCVLPDLYTTGEIKNIWK